MYSGVDMGPLATSSHPWENKLGLRSPGPEQKVIFDRFGAHLGGHPGSFWSSCSDSFDINGPKICKLLAEPFPERLQDKFGTVNLTKSNILGEGLDVVKTSLTLHEF